MSWAQNFGWKKKAEQLRMTILSAGHQGAKELPPGISKVLDLYRRVARGEEINLEKESQDIKDHPSERLLREPLDIHGWGIEATMYLVNGQLWWLVHAQRKNEGTKEAPRASRPSVNDVAILNKILVHLGADPERNMIIGTGVDMLFGWWTWCNRMPLYEIQANKDKKDKEKIRIVPLGAAESDGYVRVDLTRGS